LRSGKIITKLARMRYEDKKESGLFDWFELEKAVSERKTPLSRLLEVIDWKDLATLTQKHLNFKAQAKGGRPPKDPELMLRLCVLQSLYNLSDEEMEWQAMDRLSFRHFLGLGSADRVPDARTLWLFKERLGEKGVKALFKGFLKQMRDRGLKHREGKIVDATIMEAPRQRNSREENAQIKQGQRPETFDENASRGRQKDSDARWTCKRQTNYYGYKNHTKVDATSKIIEDYSVTDASVHDSQEIGKLITEGDGFVFADSAYDGEPVACQLEAVGVQSFIHQKGCRGRELNSSQKEINKGKSQVRARVEHVYGWMFRRGKWIIRSIGMARAQRCIGMANLVYNMDRFAFLARGAR